MRAVLQKVTGACVHVDGKLVSTIGPGTVALIGIETEDEISAVPKLSEKILSLRMWNQGVKSWDIATPPHYPPSTTRAVAPPPATASASSAAKATPPAAPAADGAPATVKTNERAEAVWGGKPWSSSVMDIEGEVLCISQFTLHARTAKGTKPDFHKSMGGEKAREIYEALLKHMKEKYRAERIKDGVFGAMMQIQLCNDGPVTLQIDTKDVRR